MESEAEERPFLEAESLKLELGRSSGDIYGWNFVETEVKGPMVEGRGRNAQISSIKGRTCMGRAIKLR